MYAIEGEVQRDTTAVLKDWATVERYLKLVAPNSPEADALFVELEARRDEYVQLADEGGRLAIGFALRPDPRALGLDPPLTHGRGRSPS